MGEPASVVEASPATNMISVLLGRVSTEDGERILETIAAFTSPPSACAFEIVIADRISDAVSAEIARRHPAVRLIACPSDMSLPAMRTIALDASHGDLIAVTEDHCVPMPGWIDLAAATFRSASTDIVAIGGSVQNGVVETGFDWATFLCEYSFFSPPVAEGESAVLPGMNIVYRRAALQFMPRAALNGGFWETTVHPLLLAEGKRFLSKNALRMYHCKKFSKRLFLTQRFLYSRYYAGIRFDRAAWAKRYAACAATVLLPPLLLWRMARSARAKGLGREFMRALPGLTMMVVVWGVGESVGYLVGPGDALARIE